MPILNKAYVCKGCTEECDYYCSYYTSFKHPFSIFSDSELMQIGSAAVNGFRHSIVKLQENIDDLIDDGKGAPEFDLAIAVHQARIDELQEMCDKMDQVFEEE